MYSLERLQCALLISKFLFNFYWINATVAVRGTLIVHSFITSTALVPDCFSLEIFFAVPRPFFRVSFPSEGEEFFLPCFFQGFSNPKMAAYFQNCWESLGKSDTRFMSNICMFYKFHFINFSGHGGLGEIYEEKKINLRKPCLALWIHGIKFWPGCLK